MFILQYYTISHITCGTNSFTGNSFQHIIWQQMIYFTKNSALKTTDMFYFCVYNLNECCFECFFLLKTFEQDFYKCGCMASQVCAALLSLIQLKKGLFLSIWSVSVSLFTSDAKLIVYSILLLYLKWINAIFLWIKHLRTWVTEK